MEAVKTTRRELDDWRIHHMRTASFTFSFFEDGEIQEYDIPANAFAALVCSVIPEVNTYKIILDKANPGDDRKKTIVIRWQEWYHDDQEEAETTYNLLDFLWSELNSRPQEVADAIGEPEESYRIS